MYACMYVCLRAISLTRLLLLLGDDGVADGQQAEEGLQPRLLRLAPAGVLLRI